MQTCRCVERREGGIFTKRRRKKKRKRREKKEEEKHRKRRGRRGEGRSNINTNKLFVTSAQVNGTVLTDVLEARINGGIVKIYTTDSQRVKAGIVMPHHLKTRQQQSTTRQVRAITDNMRLLLIKASVLLESPYL